MSIPDNRLDEIERWLKSPHAWNRGKLSAAIPELVAALREAQTERDEARAAHAELIQACGEKYEALRDRALRALLTGTDHE